MCTHMPEDAAHLSLSNCVSHWTWCSLVLLGWQTSKIWETAPLCVLSVGVTGRHWPGAFPWVTGIWFQVLMVTCQTVLIESSPWPLHFYPDAPYVYQNSYLWKFLYYILISLDFYLAICVILLSWKAYSIVSHCIYLGVFSSFE